MKVIQLWQAFLHQFPRWDLVFRRVSTLKRTLLQISVTVLVIFSFIAICLATLVVPPEAGASSIDGFDGYSSAFNNTETVHTNQNLSMHHSLYRCAEYT